MNRLDEQRWEKVERLSDKIAYVLEAVIRSKTEFLRWKGSPDSDNFGVLPEIVGILWDVAGHSDLAEAKELMKVIADTRKDRATTAKEKW